MTTDHSTPSKPRRRWFQYSLRTLFVLLTVLCVWLAVTVNRARKQREAVAAIEELGGVVYYDFQVDNSRGLLRAKLPGPKWLRELVGDEYFVSVHFVDLGNTQVTDAQLEHLKGLSNLQALVLDRTQVTDAGLEHLKGLTNLQTLSLRNCRITGAGLEHLKGLTNLQSLNLRDTRITDAGLVHLKGLTNLEWLVW